MNLFPFENIISSTNDNVIILTTHRIRSSNSRQWGQHDTTSIMLEKISSIKVTYISYPILLVVAGILGLMGLGLKQAYTDSSLTVFVVLVVACIVGYFGSRRHVCVIATDGGAKIVFQTAHMKKEAIIEFINQIEDAKAKRGQPVDNRFNGSNAVVI